MGPQKTFQAIPFLTEPERQETLSNVLHHLDPKIEKTPHYWILGHPLDYGALKSRHDQERIDLHRLYMTEHFGQLLDKTQDFFSSFFQQECFFDDRFSRPGFHLITVPPRSEMNTYFHHDRMQHLIQNIAPDLDVHAERKTFSFTVWLNEKIEGIQAGLYFFEHDDPMGEKALRFAHEKHKNVTPFATLEKYVSGNINVHNCPVHSLFGKNDLQVAQQRVTYQGHIAETKKGFMLYW